MRGASRRQERRDRNHAEQNPGRTHEHDRIENTDRNHVASERASDDDGQCEPEDDSTHPDPLRLSEKSQCRGVT